MSWIFLALAIAFDVIATTCMKLSEGFTRLLPSIGLGVFYVSSIGMLTLALRGIDISIAYAVWSGLGTATISLIGFLFFQEPMTGLRVVSIALIVMGVVGLKLSAGAQ